MKHLALRTTVLSVAVLGMTAVAAPASAEHYHVIHTPGTCVDKADAGFGTGQPDESETGPSFHTRVHSGAPGTKAFTQENNPVYILGRSVCP